MSSGDLFTDGMDKNVMRNSQHGSNMLNSCVEKVRHTNAIHLDLVNNFSAITHSTVIWKMKKAGLEKLLLGGLKSS